MGEIKIGTCGYSYFKPKEGWKENYKSKLQAFSYTYKTVEINRTFYKLPLKKTAEKWRKNAEEDFEFTLKAWQAITHPTTSPTWRNKKDKLTDPQKENFGYLKPNEDVLDAWKKTKEISEALRADVCVIQTPGSFSCTDKNEENMRGLFSKIDYDDITIAWEPRGNWKEDPEKIKNICEDLDIVHITDLMRDEPLSTNDIAYTRLHGLNENEYNYDYDYSDEELEDLTEKLLSLSDRHKKVYCMFNNYEMYKNADKLRNLLTQKRNN